MSFENAFRCATEQGTREGFSNPFFRGYFNSVGKSPWLERWRSLPQLKKAVESSAARSDSADLLHSLYSKDWETNGFTIQAGSGVDVKINNALSYRVANLEYSHSWIKELNGINYQNGLQFTTGVVLRMGTW
jgi:hypothetical protein